MYAKNSEVKAFEIKVWRKIFIDVRDMRGIEKLL
jgi:hypothetical protein